MIRKGQFDQSEQSGFAQFAVLAGNFVATRLIFSLVETLRHYPLQCHKFGRHSFDLYTLFPALTDASALLFILDLPQRKPISGSDI